MDVCVCVRKRSECMLVCPLTGSGCMCQELLEDDDNHFHGLIFAAVAHAKLGDFDSAQKRYKDALAVDSSQAVAHQVDTAAFVFHLSLCLLFVCEARTKTKADNQLTIETMMQLEPTCGRVHACVLCRVWRSCTRHASGSILIARMRCCGC